MTLKSQRKQLLDVFLKRYCETKQTELTEVIIYRHRGVKPLQKPVVLHIQMMYLYLFFNCAGFTGVSRLSDV